jgi:hypothetical protein
VLFWLKTITRYALTAIAAFLSSIVLSFLTILPFVPKDDDAPGGGIVLILLVVFEASLLIPLSLAVTAEMIQRKIQARRFQWSKALSRYLLALPVAIGPVYATIWVAPLMESYRPTHYLLKEAFFYCVSGIFAFFALRIRRQPPLSSTTTVVTKYLPLLPHK